MMIPTLQVGTGSHDIPPRVHNYLSDVLRLAARHFGENHIISGVLFGSHAKKQASVVSDCDTLIVVDNSVKRSQIRKARPDFYALEIKYSFNEKKEKFIGGILRSVEATTGMFKSFFICKEKDIDRQDFARMFSLNYFFAKILAPSKLVLGSLGKSAKVFYGEDLINKINNIDPPAGHFLKNLATTILISLSSSLIMPVTPKRDARYHLEAIKWALNGGYFYLFKSSPTLSKILRTFIKLKIIPLKFAQRFQFLRKTPRLNPMFALQSLYHIIRIHTKSFGLRKNIDLVRSKK